MQVAIAGATGLVGRELVRILLAEPKVDSIHILGRGRIELDDPRLLFHLVDFSTSWPQNLDSLSVDIVFCCLGTTLRKAKTKESFTAVDYLGVIRLAEWARRVGAKHFLVVSALGADAKSIFFYNRTKGLMEDRLHSLGLERLTIVRPSLLLGKRQEFRLGERAAEKVMLAIAPLLLGEHKKYRAIRASTVAQALYVLSQEQVPNGTIRVFESDQLAQIGR